MRTLFEPVVLEQSAAATEFALHLSAREPYLADHCPSAAPLLGTAMGLEAIAAASVKRLGRPVTEAGKVQIGRALVMEAAECEVRIRLGGVPGTQRVEGTLVSLREGEDAVMHLRAWFAAGRTSAFPSARLSNGRRAAHGLSAPLAVSGSQVYEQLFHGPCFRVIGSCQRLGPALIARLAPSLPPCSYGDANDTVFAPRLLEFALQSAGLWEIAESGQSTIPHEIDRIVRPHPCDVTDGEFTASARRSRGDGGIDIDVCDADGTRVMVIEGYRTVPMPFSSNAASLARLSTALREGREVCKP
jgi:Polyketide synthase dehydratase